MRLILATTCLLGCLPAQTEDQLYDSIYEALQRARPLLLQQLEVAQGGYLALLCLAAVHDEVPDDDPVFAAAIARLVDAELTDTYDLACRLMVMAEYAEYPNRKRQARRDAQKLLRNRVRGGFTYNPDTEQAWDLSNTQYGALGMRAAETLGINIRDAIWRDLLRAVARRQSASGGFAYTSATQPPYSSMTVAGIAVMQICKQYLGRNVPTAVKLDERLERAWQWMANHVSDIGNPEARSSYYFHYGLERAAILSGVRRVGSTLWYDVGATMLVEQQQENGGWGEEDNADAASTAFAVLFLRRKFTRLAAPITPGGGLGLGQLSESSSDADVQKVVDRELARGKRAVPDMLKAMRSDVVARRKVAAQVLFRLSGSDFGFNPHRDAEANQEAIKAAELWWLKSRGGED